jgi:hypothetical protein
VLVLKVGLPKDLLIMCLMRSFARRGVLHIPIFFSKIWFPNDVSQSHVIYHFGKCVIISWNDDTSLGNHFWE